MNEIFEEYGGFIIAVIGGISIIVIAGVIFLGGQSADGTMGDFVKAYMEQMLG